MANRSGKWDEEGGYSFNPDKDRMPLPEDDEDIDTGGEPVHNTPEDDQGSLDRSVEDVRMIGGRIEAMKKDAPDRDERVDISRRSDGPQRGITSTDTSENPEFQRRRIKNRAVAKVKAHMRSKGYSDAFIRENEGLIRQKVESFLS